MNTPLARSMSRAAELTRSGRLQEATELIRSLLQAQPAPGSLPSEKDVIEDVIEGEFTVLGDGDPSQSLRASGPNAPRTRSRLGETVRRIAAGGMPRRGVVAPMPLDLPEGAKFLSLVHSGVHGRREYRLFVPSARTEAPMPLIVMLHGCTQSPEDFAFGTGMNVLAEQFRCLVAWPAQPQGANIQKCWNWFRPEDQVRDKGEPALLAGIIRDILREHSADPARVYVAGLSAGGAAAAIMGAAYPDLIAAVCIHSGLPVGGAQDVPSAFTAMRLGSPASTASVSVPTIVFHGLSDTTVHPGNGEAVLAQALRTRAGLKRSQVAGTSKGGRTYRQTLHEDVRGRSLAEHWEIDAAGHAWAGGRAGGSFTDPKGPDASREMLRFFWQHELA